IRFQDAPRPSAPISCRRAVGAARDRLVSSTEQELLVTLDPPLAWITVNRPAARNALNLAVWRGLADHMTRIAAHPDVRIAILRGAGDEAFLSGADISEFPSIRADAAMTAEYDRCAGAALAAIVATEKPVMAMINGLCFGGGCSVALA